MSSPSSTGFDETELRKFSEAGRVIAAAVGTSVNIWARAEAGVILKTWAGRTKVASATKLARRGLLQANRQAYRAAGWPFIKGRVAPGRASINLGVRGTLGKVYYRTRRAGSAGGRRGFQDVYAPGFAKGKHIAPADWGAVSSFVESFRAHYRATIAAAKRAGGLSRQSIVQIADDLGLRLETVRGGGSLSAAGLAKARAALASNGQHYKNGTGQVSDTARGFYLTLINRYPKLGPLFMDRTLQGVIAGRLGYFRKNLEEGTFLSAKTAAKAYPFVEVLRTAA